MQPLISIIIPIYNSETYLRECIDSVLSQTYKHFELLLIDDGSSDGSSAICEEMERMDQRTRFFPATCNKGVSATRNKGISLAKGEYLFFIDSDDIIHPWLLESLYKLQEKNHSTITTAYVCSTEIPKALQKEWNYALAEPEADTYTFLTNQEALDSFVHDWPIKGLAAAGGKFIRSSAVQSLNFDESLSHGEDTKFIYQLLCNGANIAILRKNWYCYRKHKGQVTKTSSMEMHRSIHKCQAYMRDREEESGRIENAVILEGKLLTSLAIWYAESKRAHDMDNMNFLKETEKQERNRTYYSKTAFSARLSFSLAFHFTPLYWVLHNLWPYIEKLHG